MLLGALSVVQAVFLPGYLALRLSRARTGSSTETVVTAFALSLLINYLCVFSLSLIGAYNRVSALIILAAEALLVVVLLLRAVRRSAQRDLALSLPSPSGGTLSRYSLAAAGAAFLIAVAAALLPILRFDVFDAWDVLFSWNRWAYVWLTGGIPRPVALYPQLVPANWSLMYLISGSPELQLFPLSVMPLFGVAILAMFLDLALRRKRIEYLGALLLCIIAVWGLQGILLAPNESMLGGYVDLPVTFMAMAAFYLLELREDRRPSDWRQLVLPLLIASAAAVTKLNGLYALAAVLVLAALGHAAARQRLSPRDWMNSGIVALSVIALVPGTWYGFKALDFAAGRDASRLIPMGVAAEVAGKEGGFSALMLHAVSLLPGSWVTLAALVLAIVLAVRVPRARWVALGILLPYTLLWVGFLSYDLRNWMMMIPVTAYVGALGVGGLAERRWHVEMGLITTESRWRIGRRTVLLVALAVATCLIAVSAAYPASRLVTAQLQKQRLIGSAGLNDVVYSTLAPDSALAGSLLTDYAYLQFLPGFRSDSLRLEHTTRLRVTYAYHKELTPEALAGQDYLVLSNLSPPEVQTLIEQRVSSGSYSVLREFDSGPFLDFGEPVKFRVIRVNR